MTEAAVRLEGTCHCGGVTVSVPDDAYGLIACHCGDCQKLHGNFFAMLAVATTDVTWGGKLPPQWYESSPVSQRAHCPRCGSRLAKRSTEGGRTLVSAGLFPRDLPRRIVRQVWSDSHPGWYELPATAS
jgi:hypothetical protein